MSELLDIAKQLGELYKQHSSEQLTKWHIENDIEDRKLNITPVDGWQGKNSEERKLAQDRFFANDELLREYAMNYDKCMTDIAEIEGKIQALEAERRANEWYIRFAMIEALESNNVQSNHSSRTIDNSFDDVADHKITNRIDNASDVPF